MADACTLAVSGANRGLGLEFITQLAAQADTITIALCRGSSNALDKLAKKDTVHIVKCDTSDDASVREAAQAVGKITGGKLDVLINNAAVNPNIKFLHEMWVWRVAQLSKDEALTISAGPTFPRSTRL